MLELIKSHIDELFKNYEHSEKLEKVKEEVYISAEKLYFELKEEGFSDSKAFLKIVESCENAKNIKSSFEEETKKKSETVELKTGRIKKSIGVTLIVVGILGVINLLVGDKYSLLFEGWWTLFIIIPGLIGLVSFKNKTGSLITTLIGVALLTEIYFDNNYLWTIVILIAIVAVGISLIFSKQESLRIGKKDKTQECVVIFGGSDVDYASQDFTEDKYIRCFVAFGGIDIKVPNEISVISDGVSIFGGVENIAKNRGSKHTLYVEYVCLFGGIDIK